MKQIIQYPSEVLRASCEDVESFGSQISDLLDEMAQAMYAQGGVGLAAPQLGSLLNALIIDVALPDEPRNKLEIINPKILQRDGRISYEEQCLSLPDVTVSVQRSQKIHLQYYDRKGNQKELVLENLSAVAVQHEMDHLSGKLLIDYLPTLARFSAQRKMRKALRL